MTKNLKPNHQEVFLQIQQSPVLYSGTSAIPWAPYFTSISHIYNLLPKRINKKFLSLVLKLLCAKESPVMLVKNSGLEGFPTTGVQVSYVWEGDRKAHFQKHPRWFSARWLGDHLWDTLLYKFLWCQFLCIQDLCFKSKYFLLSIA